MRRIAALFILAMLLAGCAQDGGVRKADGAPAATPAAPAAAAPTPAAPAPAASDAPADAFWKDGSGRAVPDLPNRKSAGGFGSWLLVTPDADWKQKWEKPSGAGPSFREASVVKRGQKVFVMIVLGNPALRDGQADVGCAVEVLKPDGQAALRQNDIACLRGAVSGGPRSLYLATPVLGFQGQKGDPTGVWTVRTLVRDKIRGAQLLLATQFTLQ
ncbi:hypothetical protein [Variovorax sp.]|uniref:hypothetical protein n=1 Tax=Variovorax sp. TaxID=1871043 RepID=UPI002D5B547E|nr:hypothetical protein [Variovorax sp.]HYP82060.1 hypothetical protein [Variovorax sp.]